ncbi:MAG TPA: Uma2 family endonuclease [Phototrophicaceae bacterium]|nr:Uma2 family endonuclease [Phototrophicaceae bacterium]
MAAAIQTVEQYLEMERASEEKHEFRDGVVYLMSGATHRHSIIQISTLASLHAQLRKRPVLVFPSAMRLKVEKTGLYTYADGCVVCEPPQLEDDQQDTLLNPTLIIEVLSPSTETYDRGKKFQHYRALESLQEYVLIAQDQPRIERYLRQPNHEWLLSDAVGLESRLELPSIQCVLALADVYEKVDFEAQ